MTAPDHPEATAGAMGITRISDPGVSRDPALISPVDTVRAAAAVRELLLAIGENPDREGLRDTPQRYARACAELFAGLTEQPERHLLTTFDVGHSEPVLVCDIPFTSMCEHHLLPFLGVAHVGYRPGASGRITGLSKLARVVEGFARRPQVQERLTDQVASAIDGVLQPAGVWVRIEAEHLCMRMRGVVKAGSRTITVAYRGCYHEPAERAEMLALLDASPR